MSDANELDAAINGPDLFVVQTLNGQYTRNGSFSLNADGELVTKDRMPVPVSLAPRSMSAAICERAM